MADEYRVESVSEHLDNPSNPCWMIRMLKPDGTVHAHVMPKSTLAWRAAEYGISPADTDTLLDMALHEIWAPHPDDPVTAGEDPAVAAGLTVPAPASRGAGAKGHAVPVTLYTARTAAEAREAHLLRIQYTKANRVRVVPPASDADPLDVIRQEGVDPQDVAACQAHVDETRRRHRGTFENAKEIARA